MNDDPTKASRRYCCRNCDKALCVNNSQQDQNNDSIHRQQSGSMDSLTEESWSIASLDSSNSMSNSAISNSTISHRSISPESVVRSFSGCAPLRSPYILTGVTLSRNYLAQALSSCDSPPYASHASGLEETSSCWSKEKGSHTTPQEMDEALLGGGGGCTCGDWGCACKCSPIEGLSSPTGLRFFLLNVVSANEPCIFPKQTIDTC